MYRLHCSITMPTLLKIRLMATETKTITKCKVISEHITVASGRGGKRRDGEAKNGTPKNRFVQDLYAPGHRTHHRNVSLGSRTSEMLYKLVPVESKTRTHHGRVGSGGAWRGGWAERPGSFACAGDKRLLCSLGHRR